MAKFSKKKGVVIAFRTDFTKEALVFIEPDIDLGLQKIPTYSGDTVIFGKLERIGGADQQLGFGYHLMKLSHVLFLLTWQNLWQQNCMNILGCQAELHGIRKHGL